MSFCLAQRLNIMASAHRTWVRFPARSKEEEESPSAIGSIEPCSSKGGRLIYDTLLERALDMSFAWLNA